MTDKQKLALEREIVLKFARQLAWRMRRVEIAAPEGVHAIYDGRDGLEGGEFVASVLARLGIKPGGLAKAIRDELMKGADDGAQ